MRWLEIRISEQGFSDEDFTDDWETDLAVFMRLFEQRVREKYGHEFAIDLETGEVPFAFLSVTIQGDPERANEIKEELDFISERIFASKGYNCAQA